MKFCLGLAITINPKYLGQGLSKVALSCMKDIAKEMRFKEINIPVRSTLNPVEINVEDNIGIYMEENVWVNYNLEE